MIKEITMEAEEAEETVVAVMEQAVVTTITTTITKMVEEVVTMVEALVAEDIMGTTTSKRPTSNTVRPTYNSQCINPSSQPYQVPSGQHQ